MTTWKHFLLIAFVVLAAKTNSTVGSTHDEGVIVHPGTYPGTANGDFRALCLGDPLTWTVAQEDQATCEAKSYTPDDSMTGTTYPCAWYSVLEYSDDENAYFAADLGRCLPSAKASCDTIRDTVQEIQDSGIRWFLILNDVTFIPEHFKFGDCTNTVPDEGFDYGIKFQDGTEPLFLEENSLTYLIENIGVTIKYIMKSNRVEESFDAWEATYSGLPLETYDLITLKDQSDFEDDMNGGGSADIMGDDACVEDPSLCKMDRKAVLPWWSFALGFVAIPLVFSFALGAALRKK